MNEDGLRLSMNEDGTWGLYEEPYITIECKTEADYNKLQELLEAGRKVTTGNIGDISDGSHTFNELYHHRMVLFSIICNTYKECAWKSWKHDDGTMYEDYFIVGISSEVGDYTYHYYKDNWDMFNVKEIVKAPKWDGHESKDINRLYNLLGHNKN